MFILFLPIFTPLLWVTLAKFLWRFFRQWSLCKVIKSCTNYPFILYRLSCALLLIHIQSTGLLHLRVSLLSPLSTGSPFSSHLKEVCHEMDCALVWFVWINLWGPSPRSQLSPLGRSYKKDYEPLLNLAEVMRRCSREKVLMCTEKKKSPLSIQGV